MIVNINMTPTVLAAVLTAELTTLPCGSVGVIAISTINATVRAP